MAYILGVRYRVYIPLDNQDSDKKQPDKERTQQEEGNEK